MTSIGHMTTWQGLTVGLPETSASNDLCLFFHTLAHLMTHMINNGFSTKCFLDEKCSRFLFKLLRRP